MSDRRSLPGVSAMSLYVPRLRVDLEKWCQWTDNSWDKVSAVVGRSFRVCARHENVYTMAANAVLRLIQENDVDPRRVGFLGLGTESSTDNAAGAVIVRGMVDHALDALGMPRLSRHLEVPEFKHACLGGVYALKSALRFAASDGEDELAIVVAADVAEYERGSTGEQTQGAGAVAMLVEADPKLFAVDLRHTGKASDYRGPDFRKPFARHFTKGYAPNTRRLSDFPVFSGKYSTLSYLDETVHAVEDMLEKLDVSPGAYYDSVRGLFFHRPYQMMPVQAMSFLYVRGLARGDHRHDELRALAAEAGVAFQQLLDEARSKPDLFSGIVNGDHGDPYAATSAAAGILRKRPDFKALLKQKMRLGSETVRDLGNLYSAALPAWLAAGLEQAAIEGTDLLGASLVAVGYGSGDAAESMPLIASQGWEDAARRIGFARALADSVDLSREQYEALHDGTDVPNLVCAPQAEFRIARVGGRYEPSFQDLGVDYYEYVA
jgi:hydroxymethylglutaryl-CoA synthase